MKVDQKRRHRAELQIEIEDSESDFTYCRDRARDLASGLQEIVAVILRNAELEPSADDFTADAELENRLGPTQLARLQDWKSVIEIFGELRRYRQGLYNLRKRMTDLKRAATM
jgi:hypothetical protein